MAKSLEELKLECDFNQKFVDGMINKMIVGFTKYGPWRKNRIDIDAIANAKARIKLYEDTGNLDWLEDAANFLMMEATVPLRQDAHRRGTDSHEAPKLNKF